MPVSRFSNNSRIGVLSVNDFRPSDILYVGLQTLHDYQRRFLDEARVAYRVQTEDSHSDAEIESFAKRFDSLLVHLDIDVLDERLFHSTFFANPALSGDGSGGGRMTMERLGEVLQLVTRNSDVCGFTLAEYLPFDEHRLHDMLARIGLFTE